MPRLHWFGSEAGCNVMVVDLLGKSLEDFLDRQNRHLSYKTVAMLGHQMVDRVEWMHTQGIIHRDIKPDNFLMGLGDTAHKLHLIDFGLSKRYRDRKTKQHIPYVDEKKLTGTARYCSINTHLGAEQSRRDDLESIAYLMIYLVRGKLPWQG